MSASNPIPFDPEGGRTRARLPSARAAAERGVAARVPARPHGQASGFRASPSAAFLLLGSAMLLVETGVVGLLVYGVAQGMTIRAAWRARLKAGGWLPMAMLLPMVIMGVISSDPHYSLIYWLATAYALAGRG